jgi:CheY-like chemotaxis protein
MAIQSKILLLDDEPDVLDLYRELLSDLPSKPDVRTATSGARAIAMLEAEDYSLLLCDLKMPGMDGLQVLAIVRRKFPHLRTAVLTGVTDEQFRLRAYSMGIDLYLEKPTTTEGTKLLMDCVESLLGQEEQGGFRGVQSKSLVDIIQLECLSQSSAVLKVYNGVQEGKIWFLNGEVIDAITQELTGEIAFQKILRWKTGNFEILPPEPDRPRSIYISYQSLLLESVQANDEAAAGPELPVENLSDRPITATALSRFEGVEFTLVMEPSGQDSVDIWGVENPQAVAGWTQSTLDRFQHLGEALQVGRLNQVEGFGLQGHATLVTCSNYKFCVGFKRQMDAEQVRCSMKAIMNEIFSQLAST